jgi:hypothetical protein
MSTHSVPQTVPLQFELHSGGFLVASQYGCEVSSVQSVVHVPHVLSRVRSVSHPGSTGLQSKWFAAHSYAHAPFWHEYFVT